MTDLAEQAKIAAEQAFTESYKTQVTLETQSYQMTAIERAHLRKLITAHDAWAGYRSEWAIDASALDTRRVKHFCETRGIDWRAELVRFHEGSTEMAPAPKPAIAPDTTKAFEAAEARRETESERRVRVGHEIREEARKVEAKIAEHIIPPAPAAGDALTQAFVGAVWAPLFAAVKTEMDRAIEAKVGTLPTTIIEVRRADGTSHKLPATHHPMLPELIQICSARQADGRQPNVWIAGPTASGKSHAARQVAQALGVPFYVQGSMSQPFELLGFIDAGGRYHTTPFRKAFEHGGVILLDELDAGANDALLAVNSGTANGECSFPDGTVKRHPDCVIIGAANTWGSGPTAEFVGRAKIDDAVLSRFPARIHWDYDTALEVRISGNESWAKRVQNARHRANVHKLHKLIDPRHTMAGAALIAQGMAPDRVAQLTYLAGMTPEQVEQVEGRRY